MRIYIDRDLKLSRTEIEEVHKTILKAKSSPKFIVREVAGQYYATQNPEGKSAEAQQVKFGNAAHWRYGWSWKNIGGRRYWLFKWKLINEESAEIRPVTYRFKLP